MYLSLSLSEKKLADRSFSRKEDEFAVLYKKYARAVYNSVYRITKDCVVTEDIVQDAFCIAFEQLDKLKDRKNFEGWVKRIALNKAVNLFRQQKAIFIEDIHLEPVADGEQDADEEMIFQCRVEDVREAIKNLPDGYRTIISLYLLEDISQGEIAKMLNISHSTVRTQYHRAKRKVFMALKNKTYDGEG